MKVGDLWNGWKIESLIGSGSYGKVYRIVREEFGNTYESALKVIVIPEHPSDLDPLRLSGMDDESITDYYKSVVKAIISEFTIMSKMRGHSNIVSYEDHSVRELQDEFGWEICIRMELLTPLYTYIKRNAFTDKDVVRLGIDICSALEMCEKNGVIHRDIKPANIFVSNQGTFKLGDFGVARQMEKTTGGMSRKGTYSYMAPEVYNEKSYDNTVDIYSLGIVLYRFTNNNRGPFMPPYPDKISFEDTDRSNRMRLVGEVLPPPCNAGDELSAVILKACAYKPEDRYASAADLRKDLERILEDLAVQDDNLLLHGESSGSSADAQSSYLRKEIEEKEEESEKTEGTVTINTPDNVKTPSRDDQAGNSNKTFKIIVAAILVLMISAGLYFVLARGGDGGPSGENAGTEVTGEYISNGVSDGQGNYTYTHQGISITIPEDMPEDPGSEFAYDGPSDPNNEYWYRYWYFDTDKSEDYPQVSAEVRRVGIMDDEVSAKAYEAGAESIVNDVRVDEFEIYERDFGGDKTNPAREPVEIDGVTCWMISYDLHRQEDDERDDCKVVRVWRLYIPVESRGQLTEVLCEAVKDDDELYVEYEKRIDEILNSIHIQ